MSSETVWTRTHRVGGGLMMVIGGLLVVAGLMGTAGWLYVALGGAGALVIVILLYSYFIWRAEQRST